jgi:hypothetical protein
VIRHPPNVVHHAPLRSSFHLVSEWGTAAYGSTSSSNYSNPNMNHRNHDQPPSAVPSFELGFMEVFDRPMSDLCNLDLVNTSRKREVRGPRSNNRSSNEGCRLLGAYYAASFDTMDDTLSDDDDNDNTNTTLSNLLVWDDYRRTRHRWRWYYSYSCRDGSRRHPGVPGILYLGARRWQVQRHPWPRQPPGWLCRNIFSARERSSRTSILQAVEKTLSRS